jgi:predicted O-methyltransferase YrrM
LLAEGPLELGGWAMDAGALETVLAHLPGGEANVVELGAGASTIAIGRTLRARGEGRLHSLEHHAGWAAEIRERADAEGLADHVEVIHAPLAPHDLAVDGGSWYAEEALDRLRQPIDLLLIDGPPAPEGALERSRVPALHVLWERLAPGAVVILDDADRPGERWALGRWEAEFPIRFDFRRDQGIAIGVARDRNS